MSRAAGPWAPYSRMSARRAWSSGPSMSPNRVSRVRWTSASKLRSRHQLRISVCASAPRPRLRSADASAIAP